MPLHRRLPKRGFTNIFKKHWLEVSLASLEQHFEADDEITPGSAARSRFDQESQVRRRGARQRRGFEAVERLGAPVHQKRPRKDRESRWRGKSAWRIIGGLLRRDHDGEVFSRRSQHVQCAGFAPAHFLYARLARGLSLRRARYGARASTGRGSTKFGVTSPEHCSACSIFSPAETSAPSPYSHSASRPTSPPRSSCN